MEKIKLLLADDHTILREGLKLILNKEHDFEVVGEANDGRETIKLVEILRPDVVIMDITMPLLNGLEATRQIKKRFPEVDVIVLTVHEAEEYVYQVFDAGASGYLCKKSAHKDLVYAVRTICSGEYFISPTISKSVIKEYITKTVPAHKNDNYHALTEREREILQLIAEGNSNKQISDIINVSIKTVEVHRAHIMEKLDVHNTANLTRYAIRKGIVSPDA